MANRDSKLIERVLKDFSLNFKSGDGGGTKVVTELPQVGEEHIIYELQEKKKIPSLIPRANQQMISDGVTNELSLFIFVFDTSEDMTNTLTPIIPSEQIPFCLNYIIKEDKLIMSIYGGTDWQFIEATRVSDYKFDLSNGSETEPMHLVILKEYLGKSSEESGDVRYTGKLMDDELYTFGSNTSCILLGAPTVGAMIINTCFEVAEIPEDTPKELIFEYIPYEKIIKEDIRQWMFKPNGIGEVTVSSYWIYTNETWFNADEIRKFEFQEKTVRPSTSIQQITPDKGYDGLSNVTVDAIRLQERTVSANNGTRYITPDSNYDGFSKITVNPINLQGKTVSPTTSYQYVRHDSNYDGLGTVTVKSVTSDIDSNIKAENIKKGVAILGVTGDCDYIAYKTTGLSTSLIRPLSNMGVATAGSDVYLFGGMNNSSKTISVVNTIYKFNSETKAITELSTVLPQKLRDMGVATVGSYIYLFGGMDNSSKTISVSNTIYKFNVNTETITELSATLPKELFNMGVATVGSDIYLFADSSSSSDNVNIIYKFNTESETISTLSATLPQALSDMGVASVDNNIYLFGGYSNNSYGDVNTIYKFNTATETITTVSAVIPRKLRNVGVATVGRNIYLFGGYNNPSVLNTIYKFNTESETISTLSATLPQALSDMGVASVGNNIYLFGGSNTYEVNPDCLNDIYKFDTEFEGNAPTTLPITLPQTLSGIGVAQVGRYAYLFGGSNSSSSSGIVNTIYKFNSETKAITELSTVLPQKLSNIGVATFGSNIYLFGGAKSDSSFSNTIYKFNTETEAITELSATLPQALSGMGVATGGSNVYLFGGSNSSSSSGIVNTIYKFNAFTETISTVSAVIPKVLKDMGVATVGSYVYLFGGMSSSDDVNTIYKFDTETETITELSATLREKISGICTTKVGSYVYSLGGRTAWKNIFNTDDETIDFFVDSSDPSYQLKNIGVATFGSNIYLFGGAKSDSSFSNTIYKFKIDF